MESSLKIGFLRVAEKAAIAAARTMGYGKRKYSDQVAVESMREELNRLKMRGTVVIGEGERDKAPPYLVILSEAKDLLLLGCKKSRSSGRFAAIRMTRSRFATIRMNASIFC